MCVCVFVLGCGGRITVFTLYTTLSFHPSIRVNNYLSKWLQIMDSDVLLPFVEGYGQGER